MESDVLVAEVDSRDRHLWLYWLDGIWGGEIGRVRFDGEAFDSLMDFVIDFGKGLHYVGESDTLDHEQKDDGASKEPIPAV